ncbi:cyclophilin-like domain-containing protein [Gautieria morchelliformis]|nr:cyclophilin-like domain-containing protein [Gautieria morchelliformis]
MSLPTKGRVLIVTSVGDVEIELWATETPKACRNFIALALEGYYDGVIFHRVVPDFLVQTGDRTGTGGGGESFYGEPFEDEIHPRLRFAHRGLVGMANNGEKNSNDSQFFITLDRADELHGKHTLFGRCIGDTFFNVLKIGQLELEGERPVYPPKIRTVKILDNPFDDIVPRITAAEKRAQQLAREQGIREREEAARRKSVKKNTKLLSFGQDADHEVEQEALFKKKSITRPDLIQPETPLVPISDGIPQLGSSSLKAREVAKEISKEGKKQEADLSQIRQKHAKEQLSESERRQAEIVQMEASIRKLRRKRGASESGSEDDEQRDKKTVKRQGASYLEAEMAKYTTRKVERDKDGKKKRKDESDILAALNSFKGQLKSVPKSAAPDEADDTEGNPEEEGIEVDDDKTWLTHELCFPKDDRTETERAERDYEVIDPRNRSARAKEEEAERKRNQRRNRAGRR